jgi:phage tail protein X
MSEVIERVTVEGDGITVSLLVWRRFRRPMPGLLEQILNRNPGLAGAGVELPIAMFLDIPVPTPREPQLLEPIRLW